MICDYLYMSSDGGTEISLAWYPARARDEAKISPKKICSALHNGKQVGHLLGENWQLLQSLQTYFCNYITITQ